MSEEAAASQEKQLPEEMTPREIGEAFRRYDLIIAVGVLLMALFAASFTASPPDLYARLLMGRRIAEGFPAFPTVSDFTYTAPPGVVAVTPSWLFDLGVYSLWGISGTVLVASKVFLVVVTFFLLMSIRFPGPTRGWHAFCAALALSSSAAWLDVGPTVVTNLFVVLTLWIWHRARTAGPDGLAYALIPIAVLWANLDPSFFLAPLIIVPLALGEIASSRGTAMGGRGAWIAAAVGSLIAGFASPFTLSNVTYVWHWMTDWGRRLPVAEIRHTGWTGLVQSLEERTWTLADPVWIAAAFWGTLVILALAALAANYRRISWGMLAVAFLAGLAPLAAERLLGASGIVLAVVASLNAQQVYLARYGTDIRTSVGALVWSQAARVALILLVFAGLIAALTGRLQGQPARFGVSVADEEFMRSGAQWLEQSGLMGNAFAVSRAGRLAAVVTWFDPSRKAFLDRRWPDAGDGWKREAALLGSLTEPKEGDEDAARVAFQDSDVTHILVDARDESPFMRDARFNLSRRTDLAPIHADDQCVIYGRLGTSQEATIQRLRLRTNTMAFREPRDPPLPTERDTTPPGFTDWIWPLRTASRPPGLDTGTFYSLGGQHLAQPGAALLAAAYLRSAVSANPDHPDANLRLGIAYQRLAALEMSRLGPLPEPASEQELPPRRLLAQTIPMRHHQMMAALRNAEIAGAKGHGLYKALQDACEASEFKDMALDYARLQETFELSSQQRQIIEDDIRRLEDEVKQLRDLYDQRIADRSKEILAASENTQKRSAEVAKSAETAPPDQKERQLQEADLLARQAESLRSLSEMPRRLENSQIAFGFHLVKKAVEELELLPAVSPEARAGAEWATRLFLMVGDVKRARERLPMVQDQRGIDPGVYQWLLAHFHIVSGQFESAALALEGAVATARLARSYAAIEGLNLRARSGDWIIGTTPVLLMEINDEVRFRTLEANYAFELAMVRLELAQTKQAVADMSQALAAWSDFSLWPIMDFYHRAALQTGLPRPTVYNPEDDIVERFEIPAQAPSPAESPAPNPAENR